MDPQQRLLLEVAWEALEHAGHRPDRAAPAAAPACSSASGNQRLRAARVAGRSASTVYLGTGSSPAVAAGRIAYLLDLHGPSLRVDTACSSSLVAVHLRLPGAARPASATWRWPAAST